MRLHGLLLTLALAGAPGLVLAQDTPPDARLHFSGTSVGLLLGYSQGQGSLNFQGREYPFTVSGFKVATLGITRVDALGQAYRLREVADFAGRYVIADGGFTLVQGGGGTVLRNEHGVTLYLQNVQQGVDLSLGGGSLSIVLSEPAETAAAAPAPAPVPAAAP